MTEQHYDEHHLRLVTERHRDLPRIPVTQQMRDVTEATVNAVAAANAFSPSMFISGGQFARIATEVDGGGQEFTIIKHYTSGSLRGDLSRVATWIRPTQNGESDVPPPQEVVADLLGNADQFDLPRLRQVVHCPIFAPTGELQTTPGYSAATQCWYEPRDSMDKPKVPPKPTDAQVRAAALYLMEEYLGDFPFESHADRAHALALLLLPFMRQLVDGPTPLHLVEASTEGTGKGLLVRAILLLSYGADVASMTECRDEAEWSKSITAKLMTGQSIVFIDNVSRTLASAKLASVLTQPIWEDRILGASQMLVVPVEHVFIAAGNNVSMSGEIVRRTIRIRINAHTEQPWLREGWRHDPLIDWGKENRRALVEAALTIIQAWIARGRPSWTGKPLGSFESWARVVGGVLQVANERTAFLGNLDQLYAAAGKDTDGDRVFVHAWWERFQGMTVLAKDLVPLAAEHLELVPGAAGAAGLPPSAKSVGRHLIRLHGRVFDTIEVVRTPRAGRGDSYQLVQVRTAPTSTPSPR